MFLSIMVTASVDTVAFTRGCTTHSVENIQRTDLMKN